MKRTYGRRSRRGVTLIELMVGVVIALFLTAAAVLFVQHETRLMGISQDRLDMIQGSRVALDLMSEDLRKAGQGIGYDAQGNFQGLLLGQFNAGNVRWNPDGGPASPNPSPVPPPPGFYRNVTLRMTDNGSAFLGTTYVTRSVDVGVQFADGAYSTIANWNGAGTLEMCRTDEDEDGAADPITDQFTGARERVVMRHEAGLDAYVVELSGMTPIGVCTTGDCLFGCLAATWAPFPGTATDPTFRSGPNAADRGYLGGEIQGNYGRVIWFIATDNTNTGLLQRVRFNGTNANTVCPTGADTDCGGSVARGVESLQMQVWQWDTITSSWVNVGQGPINNPNPGQPPPRLRVDVELVVKAEGTTNRLHPQVALRLRPGSCIPGPCASPPAKLDYTERRAYRTSVEIKNSGRMTLR